MMNISRFIKGSASLAHEDTILASDVLPPGVKAPFDHAWGYLDAPGEMDPHTHHNQEIYIFIKGDGFVKIDGEKRAVSPGDVVQVPPDSLHSVANESDGELLWAAFWWPLDE